MLMINMSKITFANYIYSPLAAALSSKQLVRWCEITGAILSVCESLGTAQCVSEVFLMNLVF